MATLREVVASNSVRHWTPGTLKVGKLAPAA
jgi:hypothetical protein